MAIQIAKNVLEIRIPSISVIVATILLFFIASFYTSRISINGKYSKMAGLFVGLDNRSAYHFTAVWIKIVFIISIMIFKQRATLIHYYILFILIGLSIILGKGIKIKIAEIFGGALSVAGIWISSLFIEYLLTVKYDIYIEIGYWIIVLLAISCLLVIFELEIISISSEKKQYAIKAK